MLLVEGTTYCCKVRKDQFWGCDKFTGYTVHVNKLEKDAGVAVSRVLIAFDLLVARCSTCSRTITEPLYYAQMPN